MNRIQSRFICPQLDAGMVGCTFTSLSHSSQFMLTLDETNIANMILLIDSESEIETQVHSHR